MIKDIKNKGFTLVETIIAILLLMITVTAILMLVSSVLISTKGQRMELTAQYLLQEGVEYMRSNRDSALNGGATWSDYTQVGSCPTTIGAGTISVCPCNFPSGTPGECMIDSIFDEVSTCPPTGCPNMWRVENLGNTIFCSPGTNCPSFYTPAEQTTFTRSVRLTINPMNPDELFLNVKVGWVDINGVSREKVLNTSLFNW